MGNKISLNNWKSYEDSEEGVERSTPLNVSDLQDEMRTLFALEKEQSLASIRSMSSHFYANLERVKELDNLKMINETEAAESIEQLVQSLKMVGDIERDAKATIEEYHLLQLQKMSELSGLSSVSSVDIQQKIDMARESISKGESELSRLATDVSSRLDELETISQHLLTLESDVSNATEELKTATSSTIKELVEKIDKGKKEIAEVTIQKTDARAALDAFTSTMNARRSSIESDIGSANQSISSLERKEGTAVDEPGLVMRRLQTIMAPMNDLKTSLQRIHTLIQSGYETYAKSLIEGQDISTYLETVNKVVDLKTIASKDYVQKQLQEVEFALVAGSEEERIARLISLTAEYLSPSFKFRVMIMEDLEIIRTEFEARWWWIVFRIGYTGVALVDLSIKTVPFLFLRGLELTMGTEAATILYDTITSILKFGVDVVATAFLLEVQLVLLGFYATIHAFIDHNFGTWLNNVLTTVIPSGLVDQIQSIRILQYDDFSSLVNQKTSTVSADQLWRTDHKEFKFVLDYWCDLFFQLQHQSTGFQHIYTPYADYKSIVKRVGKYINPANHPYDTDEELQQSLRIEQELDGGLVDNPYNSLCTDVIPKRKGLVRNLVHFPASHNTVAWPNPDGVMYQSEGNFWPRSVDDHVSNLWIYWAESGAWGTAFNYKNATEADKKKAIETNLKDLKAYLDPQIDDPLVAFEIKDWLTGNNGTKKILQQDMSKLTLATLQYEMTHDVDNSPRWVDIMGFKSEIPFNEVVEDFILEFKNKTGRYPATPIAMKFYDQVINEHKIGYITFVNVLETYAMTIVHRKATEQEIGFYTNVKKQIISYFEKLKSSTETTQQTWEQFTWETTFSAWKTDTGPRNTWGYITKYRILFIGEIQEHVNIMAQDKKESIWKEYLRRLQEINVPLNTNRFQRLAFTAKMNYYGFSDDPAISSQFDDQIKAIGKNVLENQLFTTGVTTANMAAWAKKVAIHLLNPLNFKVDFPVMFGDLHARVIVISDPKPTCFILFRGTTNAWEWTIDADFSASEVMSLQVNEHTFQLNTIKSTIVSEGAIAEYERVRNDPNNIILHQGFYRAWLAFRQPIIDFLLSTYQKYDIQDVIVTGHSLGGAIAQIACLEIPSLPRKELKTTTPSMYGLYSRPTYTTPGKITYIRPHGYFFSSPAPGDRKFSLLFARQVGESAFSFIDGDIVTMVPLFFIPSKESWGDQTVAHVISDLFSIRNIEGRYLDIGWTIVSRVFQSFNLPVDVNAWRTNGKFDWNKIGLNAFNIYTHMNEYKAYHGQGVYLRMQLSGYVTETAYDSSISESAFSTIMSPLWSIETAKYIHILATISKTMDLVAERNPDLFAQVDRMEFPDWNKIITNPPPEEPPTVLYSMIQQGKAIAMASTRKRSRNAMFITSDDIIPGSIVKLPDHEQIQDTVRRANRRKRTRIVDSTYL